MLLDRSQINEVKQRSDSRINTVIELPAFLVCQPRGLDEFGSAIEVLLKEHRRFDAAWIALQYRRSLLQVRHDVIGDLQIEAEQIKLGELFVGPVNTIQAGD